jgi:hypothetical protein
LLLLTEDSLPAAGHEGIDVEIEEQANVQIRTSQVRQELRGMHRGKRVSVDPCHSASSDLSEPSVSRCFSPNLSLFPLSG